MTGLGQRTAILTLCRFANYGLMMISPIILVRLLSVGEFGRYREFLLYVSLLVSFATLSINESLLYFVPRYPESIWRVVRQTVLLVACSSIVVVAVVAVADILAGGTMLGGFRTPLAVYTLLFSNIDFWESLLLARGQPLRMFAYTSGRLLARLLVVVGLAAATRDVQSIVWGLIGLETVRLAISTSLWRLSARERLEPPVKQLWREQLQFCVPTAVAVILGMGNQSLGNVVVAKAIGAAALAQFTIGTYGQPIVEAARNSISAVVLPEMVRLSMSDSTRGLLLWKQSTVVNCMVLFPCAVLVFHFAEQLVVTVFGVSYRPAVPLLQIYVFGLLRSCVDFVPALRAINKTRPLVYGSLAALIANALCLWFLVPAHGLAGAMWSWVVSEFVDALLLGAAVLALYGTPFRRLLPWRSLLSVAAAAVGASPAIMPGFWVTSLGFFGVVLASLLYLGAFVAISLTLRIPEAWSLWYRARRFAAAAMA